MDLGLEEKIVLISGATGGIGASLCEGFLREGATVAASYRGSSDRLAPVFEIATRLKLPRERVIPVEMDLLNASSLAQGVATLVERTQRIDVLVNNAGYAFEFPFVGTPEEELEQVLDINLKGTYLLSQAVLKQMIHQHSGCILTITSTVGKAAGRGVSIYASAKAALSRWTEILSIESAKKGIRVNAVAPGAIDTRMSQVLMKRAGDQVLGRTPMSRIGQPNEVVPAVLFLASEKTASFITGQTLYVDGGLSCG